MAKRKGQQCLLMSERLSCEQEAGVPVTCRLADGNLERICFAWRRVEMVRLFCSQPLICSLVDSTYDCKTQQNAALTGQEEEGDVQLKVS